MNVRLYRTAWLILLVPLVLAAFTIVRPVPLPPSTAVLESTFDTAEAARLARELDAIYPDRAPGSPSAAGATRWMQRRLAALFPGTEVDRFTATIPGRGRTELRNVIAVVPGRSLSTIVVLAHRDSTAGRAGLVDNASGTAALVELARAYSGGSGGGVEPRSPNHTLVFASTDAGAYGLLGARRLARSPHADRAVAVISLDGIATGARPQVEIAGRGPGSPPPRLLATVLARLSEERGPPPQTASPLSQLVDLALPLALTEQLELLGEGVPAVAITADGRHERDALRERLDTAALGRIGRAAEATLGSLDASLEPPGGTAAYLQVRGRIIQGWAIGLTYVAALVPFLLTLLDLLSRLRRRRIGLRRAYRSYLRRLGFWLWAGGIFLVFAFAGAWPGGETSAVNPASKAAGHWPRLGLALFALVAGAGWLVARVRLLPRRPVTPEDEAAGITVALTALALLAFVTVATNIYALLLLLPSLHAWLFLVHARDRPAWARGVLYVAGLTGPLLVLGSVALRLGLGLDAPWYLAELTAIGYVPMLSFALALACAAAAAQVLAAVTGRYAPYPRREERPRGLLATMRAAVSDRAAHAPAGPPRSEAP